MKLNSKLQSMEKFTHVFTSSPIVIPEVNLINFINDCEVQFRNIDHFLKKRPRTHTTIGGKSKRLVTYLINEQIGLNDMLDFINQQNGICATPEGLSIAMPLLENKIRHNKAVWAPDFERNLWNKFIPFCSIKKDRYYFGLSIFAKYPKVLPKTSNSYLIYFSD